MGLKLLVTKGDKIMVGDNCIITVNALGARPQLQFDAPADVKIVQIHADPKNQWKNKKKEE